MKNKNNMTIIKLTSSDILRDAPKVKPKQVWAVRNDDGSYTRLGRGKPAKELRASGRLVKVQLPA